MSLLFHHDISVAVLGSGSKGNCTYVGDGRQGVLFDCGMSAKQILTRLEAVGLGQAPIDAVLVTHEHQDHVGGARVLENRLLKRGKAAPTFYMTRGTRLGLRNGSEPKKIVEVDPGQSLDIRQIRAEAYTVPHDTRDPVAWVVEIGSLRVGVLTDLGRSNALVQSKLASLDIAVLEFNHDLEMLAEGPYPWHLKQRIRGAHGHLSNDQAAALLVESASAGRLKSAVLAHLSEENNSPHKALAAAKLALAQAGLGTVDVQVAQQRTPLPPIVRRVPYAEPVAAPTPRRTTARATPSERKAPSAQQGLFSK